MNMLLALDQVLTSVMVGKVSPPEFPEGIYYYYYYYYYYYATDGFPFLQRCIKGDL
jgi:hypothetical protein